MYVINIDNLSNRVCVCVCVYSGVPDCITVNPTAPGGFFIFLLLSLAAHTGTRHVQQGSLIYVSVSKELFFWCETSWFRSFRILLIPSTPSP